MEVEDFLMMSFLSGASASTLFMIVEIRCGPELDFIDGEKDQ